MALSSDQLSIISNSYLVNLYDQMEQEVLADITRRVRKTERFTETAEIQARNMREQGYNTQQIMAEVRRRLNGDAEYQKAISENTKEYKQEVMELIRETEAEALAAGDMLTAMAGDMSFNDDMQMWAAHNVDLKKDNALKQITDAAKDQLAGDLKNITGTGRKSNLYLGGANLVDAYTNQLDLALIKMITGNMSYTQAVKDCVQRAAAMGITVKYKKTMPDGTERVRNYQLDTAVRMCVRTASTQLAGKISEHNMDKTKQDLVYVDAHAGARPSHAVWQGQVYAYTTAGQTLNGKKYKDFWTETDYGSPTGLKGINCSHNFYPYWEGDPIPEFKEPDPVDIDGKTYTYYEATQEQRKQERNVRAMKRELTTAKAAGDDQKVAELQKRISEAYKKYNKFSGSANLRPKYERMGVWDNPTNSIPNTLNLSTQGNTFVNKSEELYKNALKIEPIKNYTDIVSHGDPYSLVIKDLNGNEINVSAETFCNWIDAARSYKGGNIRLMACDTGAEGGIIPKYMARRYNANIMAPNTKIYVESDGNFILASSDEKYIMGKEDGSWILFKPDGSEHKCDKNGNILESIKN